MNPLFISMESIDGLGKTTQIEKLQDHLVVNKGLKLYRTKEPGDSQFGSVIGKDVRKILFGDSGTKLLAPGVSDLLFLADHVQNSFDIEVAVNQGEWVITDRYADSQFAYSGSDVKRCPDWAYRYYQERFGIKPDVTILMIACNDETGSAMWALERAQKRMGSEAGKQDGKAWNNYEEQMKIQSQYVKNLIPEDRTIIVTINKEDSPDFVHKLILNSLKNHYLEIDTEYGPIFQK